jgi:hypothetical protein
MIRIGRPLLIPKPKRFESAAYLAFIRSLPCTACDYPVTEAHHLKTRGAGGSDLTAIPLCRQHHTQIHTEGTVTAMDKWWRDPVALRLSLLEKYVESL